MVTSLGGYLRCSRSVSVQRVGIRFGFFRGKSFADLRKDLHTNTPPDEFCTV
jgi:hypothetical protein